jgi:hypothetical protein
MNHRHIAAWLLLAAILAFLGGCGGSGKTTIDSEEVPPPVDINAAGGVILVYEMDDAQEAPAENRRDRQPDTVKLAAQLQRRIDPEGRAGVTVRPAKRWRFEILVPNTGKRNIETARKDWQRLLKQVRADWAGKLQNDQGVFEVDMGQVGELAERIRTQLQAEKWPPLLAAKETWAELTETADNWNADLRQVGKIKPGDFRALARLVVDQPRAVAAIQHEAEMAAWKATLARLEKIYPRAGKLDPEEFPPNHRDELVGHILAEGHLPKKVDEQAAAIPAGKAIAARIDDLFGPTEDAVLASIKHHVSPDASWQVATDELNRIQELISRSGKLEFVILANSHDDAEGVQAARTFLRSLPPQELEPLQKKGQVIPGPKDAEGRRKTFAITLANGHKGRVGYRWLEMGTSYRRDLRLLNKDTNHQTWQIAARARAEGKVADIPDSRGGGIGWLYIYSRDCKNQHLSEDERREKKYDYFILARDPENDAKGAIVARGGSMAVTGDFLKKVDRGRDQNLRLSIDFELDTTGAALFAELTGNNVPERAGQETFYRHLAIVLDGQVMSAPTINSRIGSRGQITGDFNEKQVDGLIAILRSGSLPIVLKPHSVKIITVPPARK